MILRVGNYITIIIHLLINKNALPMLWITRKFCSSELFSRCVIRIVDIIFSELQIMQHSTVLGLPHAMSGRPMLYRPPQPTMVQVSLTAAHTELHKSFFTKDPHFFLFFTSWGIRFKRSWAQCIQLSFQIENLRIYVKMQFY